MVERQASKRGRPTSNVTADGPKNAHFDQGFARRAAKWNLEQTYEQRPRKKRKQEKETTRLPVKTPEGRLQPSILPDVSGNEDATSSEASDVAENGEDGEAEATAEQLQPDMLDMPVRQQIVEGKEELARIAGLINEDPEANVSQECWRLIRLRTASDVLLGVALSGPLSIR